MSGVRVICIDAEPDCIALRRNAHYTVLRRYHMQSEEFFELAGVKGGWLIRFRILYEMG